MFKKHKVLYAIAIAVLLVAAIGVAIYFYHSYLVKKEHEAYLLKKQQEHEAYLLKKQQEHEDKIFQQENKIVTNVLNALSRLDYNTRSQLYPNTNWLPIDMGADNDTFAVNLDNLLKNTNATKTFWATSITPNNGPDSTLWKVNCKNQSFVELFSDITYDNEGNIENDKEYQGGKLISVPPNSALFNIVNFVCLPNIKDITEEFEKQKSTENNLLEYLFDLSGSNLSQFIGKFKKYKGYPQDILMKDPEFKKLYDAILNKNQELRKGWIKYMAGTSYPNEFIGSAKGGFIYMDFNKQYDPSQFVEILYNPDKKLIYLKFTKNGNTKIFVPRKENFIPIDTIFNWMTLKNWTNFGFYSQY